MKRLIIIILLLIALCGCGSKNIDVGKIAIICLPNGEIVEGKVEGITRWSEGLTDITIDGVKYTLHSAMVAVKEDTDG